MVVNLKVSTKKAKKMAKVQFIGQIRVIMMVNGNMINKMDKVFIIGITVKIVISTMVNGSIIA